MPTNRHASTETSRRSWRTLWMKAKSKSRIRGPNRENRSNDMRWPRQEEEGHFCDSILTALWSRGHLDPIPTNTPSSHNHNGAVLQAPAARSSTEMVMNRNEEAERASNGEPVTERAFRLVKRVLAKKRPKSSRGSHSLHHSQSHSDATPHQNTAATVERPCN